jgi:hypothetical protein
VKCQDRKAMSFVSSFHDIKRWYDWHDLLVFWQKVGVCFETVEILHWGGGGHNTLYPDRILWFSSVWPGTVWPSILGETMALPCTFLLN